METRTLNSVLQSRGTHHDKYGCICDDAPNHDTREEKYKERIHISQGTLYKRLSEVYRMVVIVLNVPQQQLNVVTLQRKKHR